MDDAKLQISRIPPGPGDKISTLSISFAAAPAHKELRSRHPAMTADLYSYPLRDKMWTVEIRNAFEEAK